MSARKSVSYVRWIPPIMLWAFIALLGVAVFLPPGHYIDRSRPVRAIHEIKNIETAITKLLADADASNLRDFFDEAEFDIAVKQLEHEQAMDAFAASVEIYSYSAYVLLRKGRNSLGAGNDYRAVLKPALVERLGTSYVAELAEDPWGNLYCMYPGPWPDEMGPVLFRIFLPPTVYGHRSRDKTALEAPNPLLMTGIDPETGEPISFGVPAPSDQDVYIWSFGANGISGQPKYDPSHVYAPPAQQYFEPHQEPELCGGGDDINNWDKALTFMRFYN